jgi:hypothetical protein
MNEPMMDDILAVVRWPGRSARSSSSVIFGVPVTVPPIPARAPL